MRKNDNISNITNNNVAGLVTQKKDSQLKRLLKFLCKFNAKNLRSSKFNAKNYFPRPCRGVLPSCRLNVATGGFNFVGAYNSTNTPVNDSRASKLIEPPLATLVSVTRPYGFS